jgi:enamine deaminase RidA (YjgF/YER057c/UK114 family)
MRGSSWVLGVVAGLSVGLAVAGGQERGAAAASPLSRLNPEGLSKSPNYSQVVAAPRGRIVFVSGQLATDAAGKLVGAGDFRAQADQVLKNLETALTAAGATWSDVVMMRSYVIGLGKNLDAFREARRRALGGAPLPASTTVGVAELARPEALLEVEVIAVLPRARPSS